MAENDRFKVVSVEEVEKLIQDPKKMIKDMFPMPDGKIGISWYIKKAPGA